MSQQYKQEAISDEQEHEKVEKGQKEEEEEEKEEKEEISKEEKHQQQKEEVPHQQDVVQQKEQKQEERDEEKQEQDMMEERVFEKEAPQKNKINHIEIGKYANDTMQIEEEENENVKIKIIGNESRGSVISKYTVYVIKGFDKNGEINTCRRFSEFHALRSAMVKRWPGCFIPSIPGKNLMKNDKEEIVKRERYLNDFLHKMASLPHLYNSEEFQAFVRSKQADVTNLFSSWSSPTSEQIINKYGECFGALSGKEINENTNEVVSQFYSKIKKNLPLFEKYRFHAKNLAISKDKFNESFPKIFDTIIPNYEKTFLAEYVEGREEKMVYLNSEEVKLPQQASIAYEVCRKNPYWILYDLLKHEQRDGKAFIESYSAIESLESKKNSLDSKIKDNEKAITDLSEGKKNVKSMSSKGTAEEVKYKLEVDTEELKKEKDLLMNLIDIISALIVFIEIPQYKKSKVQFYQNTMKKIGGYEINAVQLCAEIWSNTAMSSSKMKGQN